MKYSVPCECGRRVAVTADRAGLTARCECDRDVTVPSLSELRRGEDQVGRPPGGREADRSGPRMLGVMLILSGLLLSCVTSNVLAGGLSLAERVAVAWTVSIVAMIGTFLIALSKRWSVLSSVIVAVACPLAGLVILFLADPEPS